MKLGHHAKMAKGKKLYINKYLSATAACLFITIATTNATTASQFSGTLKGVTITDSAKSNAPPTPVFKYTRSGNSFAFDASGSADSDGSIIQYKWDFGDGTNATGATASHQYATTGSYPVTLTVVDNASAVAIAQQQLDTSKLFYWSMDSLPQTTMVSDAGNVTITKYSQNGTSVVGFKGNCLHQTGTGQAYKIPMTTLPSTKGTIQMYVQHDTASVSTDATNRHFFTSTKSGVANALYAYTYKGNVYFQLYDSAGSLHRVYGTATWNVGQWYLYEFTWDAATGYINVKRDGTVLLQATTTSWINDASDWTGQEFFIGYNNPLGGIDEFSILQ